MTALATAKTGTQRPPATCRDWYFDALRALAMLAVVAGHWLTTAIVADTATWHVESPLTTFPGLAWVTLLVQPLAVFFLVGGLLTAGSYRRARARGICGGTWLGRRFRRILLPAVVAIAVWLTLAVALVLIGVPYPVIRTCVVTLAQPLWFLGIYVAITALTPAAVWAAARWGYRVPAAMAVIVAAVDAGRYGPLAAHLPAWIGMINMLPGWFFGFQLGVGSALRPPSRRAAIALTGAGALTWALCVCCAGYPPTPMGPAVDGRINSHPPSLLVVAATAAAVGALWWAEPALRRRLDSLRLRKLTRTIAPVTLSLLCWHQAALVAVCALGALLAPAGVAGLTTAPASVGWLVARIGWLPVFAVVLRQLTRVLRPLELQEWGRRTPTGIAGADKPRFDRHARVKLP